MQIPATPQPYILANRPKLLLKFPSGKFFILEAFSKLAVIFAIFTSINHMQHLQDLHSLKKTATRDGHDREPEVIPLGLDRPYRVRVAISITPPD